MLELALLILCSADILMFARRKMASNGPEQAAALAPMSKWNKDALISLERDLKVNLNLDELTDSLERPAGGFMTEVEKM